MSTALKRRTRPRRGVTLVEMLVVVALVVLMMVILVQIFQSALGAMSASRTTQELDVVLRSVDSMIRSDLGGITAKMTPPNNPLLKQGYFEYGENAPADLQGEDTDDFLAFTTKAPEGQVFTGRQYLSTVVTKTNAQQINQAIQPATVTSQVAEVIYFLRNGNLYRRVFLVAPERKNSIASTFNQFYNVNTNPNCNLPTSMFGNLLNVSWQGLNEISCRPGGYTVVTNAAGTSVAKLPPIPNDLGDLSNRENRAFRPRFLNDFTSLTNPGFPDGLPDDSNGDSNNDYYPTLYYDGIGFPPTSPTNNWAPNSFVRENITALPYPLNDPSHQRVQKTTANSRDVYAFPYIYPGMYSVVDPARLANPALGWVHSMAPNATSGYINHSPLDIGDTANFAPSGTQTWFGFPTWQETMAGRGSGGLGWTDPIAFVTNTLDQQPLGLRPFDPTLAPASTSTTFPPPVHNYGTTNIPYGYDGAGSNSFVANPNYPAAVWQDDLILSNVRSFDVKAYDPNAALYNPRLGPNIYLSAGYYDLGYAGLNYNPSAVGYLAPNYSANSTVFGPNGSSGGNQFAVPFQAVGGEPTGFGHEGRIPPISLDFRMHPRRGYNIGDDNLGVTRLTHTFDTWSTDYVNAPDSDILLFPGVPVPSSGGLSYATFPSFPPPYPSPLRGIQIQLRVTDPRGERTKVLTIRFDLTDKL